MLEYHKRTDADAVAEANAQLGPGWLLPIALSLAAGGLGYSIAGVSGIFYAETSVGAVTVVVLTLKSLLGVGDGNEKIQLYVPVEREND